MTTPKKSTTTKATVNAHAVAAACLVKAKDDPRWYLQGVFLTPAKKGCLIVATDGHRLLVINDPLGSVEEDQIRDIPPLMIAQCKLGKARTLHFMNRTQARLMVQLHSNVPSDTEHLLTVDSPLLDGPLNRKPQKRAPFISWRKVLDEKQAALPKGEGTGVNPTFLKDLAAIEKLLSPTSDRFIYPRVMVSPLNRGPMVFHFGGSEKSKAEDLRAVYIVMPVASVRAERKEAAVMFPDWAK